MSADVSTTRLLEVLHQHYPPQLISTEDAYVQSEQYRRLLRARQEALKNSGPWTLLLSKLREALPDCRVEDWSALFSDDNCWRVRVYLPEVVELEGGAREHRAVVVLVSILAPVYVRYTSFHRQVGRSAQKPSLSYEDVPETKSYAEKVEALVRSELGVQRLPRETLFTGVPDLQCRHTEPGKTQLIDCLFTDDRW